MYFFIGLLPPYVASQATWSGQINLTSVCIQRALTNDQAQNVIRGEHVDSCRW